VTEKFKPWILIALIAAGIMVAATWTLFRMPEAPSKGKIETQGGILMIKLETNKGDILLSLNAEKAPETVANFVQYVTDGHYDGTIFHRVIN